LIIGGQRVRGGELTVGELVAFQVLMVSLLSPFERLIGLAGSLFAARADVERLDDVLTHPPDPAIAEDPAPAGGPPAPPASATGLELRRVTFGYSPGAPLIEALDASIPPGGRLALVGSSGSGKSTVARMVCGLYQPWAGEIVFGGRPRDAFPRDVLARAVRSVDQDVFLFEGTVRDNLTLWDPDVPDAALERAAADACILDSIRAREGGFDSPVAEGGGNFSGGERQRLEIARALVGEPRLLVLDEATSSLDAVTEAAISQNLRRRGCTCLVVAHRLSTIRDADEIVVLDRGRVVERGTHDQLLAAGQAYARLVESE
ncbi:MAG TPA: ATP-binding cassette domain-containing protein, partial [Acidimicrobiales bacterium]